MTLLPKALVAGLASATFVSVAVATVDADHTGSGPNAVKLPSDYRDWRFVSLAHEADGLNDIRVVLGNQLALDAFRSGRRPFPDGTVIARLAYKYGPSYQNNAIFGTQQSYVAGDPTNIQVSVKNSVKYARTGGWSYGQFKGGKPDVTAQSVETCFACHNRLPAAKDLVFTNYAP